MIYPVVVQHKREVAGISPATLHTAVYALGILRQARIEGGSYRQQQMVLSFNDVPLQLP